MRILHVLDHSAPLHSGYTFRTLAILAEQRALGWETTHLTSVKHTVATALEDEAGGFAFHRTLPSTSAFERVPGLHPVGVINGLARRLAEVAATVKPDVLHAHSPCLNGVAALRVGRRLGIPVVYEMRALWEDGAVSHGRTRDRSWRYRLTRALETHVVRRADAVTTICDGLKRDLIQRGIAEDRITVIPNAVDVATFTPGGVPDPTLVEALGVAGRRVLGFLGSFYSYEGLHVLLRAVPRIVQCAPDVRILLVGGGFEDEALRREARGLGVAGQVIFAGRIAHEDIGRYYDLLDVCVYPRVSCRLTEVVTPLKPLEAMAQGRLVVASDVGGHRELIRDGETGLLFRAGDPDALATAVLDALGDPGRAAIIREKARRWVERERTWTGSIARYASVYARVTRSTPPVMNLPARSAAG